MAFFREDPLKRASRMMDFSRKEASGFLWEPKPVDLRFDCNQQV